MVNSINERIRILFSKSGEKSIRQYAIKIGVAPTTLNECIKGAEPKYTLLNRIISGEPSISSKWLLTGEGDMETELPRISYSTGRPYYNVDFIGGFDLVMNDQTYAPEYNIDFAPYNKDGVVWCNITGRSMEPEINSGDIIALKEVRQWNEFIAIDEVYAIVTKNDLRTVKRIKKGSTEGKYLLVPTNPNFSPQEIDKKMIDRVYAVLGCMKRF
jgi:hypothetical protein